MDLIESFVVGSVINPSQGDDPILFLIRYFQRIIHTCNICNLLLFGIYGFKKYLNYNHEKKA
jgi:hypothetical protein